ncbi:MAG TPA: tol-pal system protein YbgF [Gammaproteobacteria bacterium]|nr:tol-pal system protein YbgF [Gammaproteobacteria bacterium]
MTALRASRKVTGPLLGAALMLALPAGPVRAADPPANQGSLDARVSRLEKLVENGTLVQMVNRLDQLEAQVRDLRGQVETQEHALEQLRSRQRDLYVDIDRRLRRLEVAGQAGQSANQTGSAQSSGQSSAPDQGTSASGGPGQGAASGSSSDTAAARDAYQKALGVLKNGQYQQAAKAFESFIGTYSDSAYADNAQYWLGETYYVTRKFPQSLAAFRKVISQYPKSSKVPDARLKIGYILYEQQKWDKAREALSQVVHDAPDSTAARLAQDRLQRMKREGH